MTPENFCYWLQGFIETANPTSIDELQTKVIKDHLQLVFNKVTPKYYTDDKWKAQIVNMQHINGLKCDSYENGRELLDQKNFPVTCGILHDFKEYNYTPIVDIKTMESC